jgi:arylsulfatase A-like enzyme
MPTRAESAASRPNFVFFLVDDLGWADLGCFGSKFYETPNIDALAASGMRFTNGYAACPVCSPTRASIMTGRHPVRVDITDWIPGNSRKRATDKFVTVQDRDNLALEEVTIAEVLRDNGYQTFFAGKWHLGGEGHWPTDQGFDINIGGCDKGSPPGGYYAPWTNPNLQAKHKDEYLTERLTEESIAFLEQRTPERPFLLYLSYYNVHTPITPYKRRFEQFEDKAERLFNDPTPVGPEHFGQSRLRQDNPAYASMIAAVDDSVGEILGQLNKLNLTDNTVVFFFSDNGGLCTLRRPGPTCNLPLRSGKGWLYEGGVREPMIVRAPGTARPGSVCDAPVVSTDFFPTMLQLAGLPLMPERHADGQSLVPLLKGGQAEAPRALYWHYPHYHGSTWTPGASIRDGDWKLIEFYEWDQVEVYNLREDPGEQRDLSLEDMERTGQLRGKLRAWQQRMKAKMPKPNVPFAHHYIDRRLPGSAWGQTAAADLDQDGRLDFITGRSRREIVWYRMETADRWTRHPLGEQSPSDVGGAALDVDGDGWTDFVTGGAWYRNTGKPRTEPFERIVFDVGLNAVHDVVVADVDGDGRSDVLTMSDKNNLRWYRIPTDPRQPWQRQDIGPSVHAGIGVGDLDGDGDLDVARSNLWFENTDGRGTRWTTHENIPFGNPDSPFPLATHCVVLDVDGDDDQDLIMTENEIRAGRIGWLENRDGRGGSWRLHELPAGDPAPRGAYHSLVVADFDGDGDSDVFSCEMEGIAGDRPPRWYLWENTDGAGQRFVEHVVLDARLGGHLAVGADFDGDGDIDLISKLWRPREDNGNGGNNHVDFLENLWQQK